MEDKCVEGIILSIRDYKIIKGAQTAQHQGDIKYGEVTVTGLEPRTT